MYLYEVRTPNVAPWDARGQPGQLRYFFIGSPAGCGAFFWAAQQAGWAPAAQDRDETGMITQAGGVGSGHPIYVAIMASRSKLKTLMNP